MTLTVVEFAGNALFVMAVVMGAAFALMPRQAQRHLVCWRRENLTLGAWLLWREQGSVAPSRVLTLIDGPKGEP